MRDLGSEVEFGMGIEDIVRMGLMNITRVVIECLHYWQTMKPIVRWCSAWNRFKQIVKKKEKKGLFDTVQRIQDIFWCPHIAKMWIFQRNFFRIGSENKIWILWEEIVMFSLLFLNGVCSVIFGLFVY